jgi:hypothetical protein
LGFGFARSPSRFASGIRVAIGVDPDSFAAAPGVVRAPQPASNKPIRAIPDEEANFNLCLNFAIRNT